MSRRNTSVQKRNILHFFKQKEKEADQNCEYVLLIFSRPSIYLNEKVNFQYHTLATGENVPNWHGIESEGKDDENCKYILLKLIDSWLFLDKLNL